MKNKSSQQKLGTVLLFSELISRPLLLVCVFSCIFGSCKFSNEKGKVVTNKERDTSLQIVENAIRRAGTMEKWKRISSLSYTKRSKLLLENGAIESEVIQRHHYVLRPSKSIRISWAVAKDSFLIIQNDSVSHKFKNDSLIEQGRTVTASVNSAMYVLGMPFKLLDKGTVLKYDGLTSFNGIDTVHTINATYEPKKHHNHSTQDDWWYHFDKNNSAFLSSMVYHEPTYALIENLAVVEKGGLTFPERRKSYRCDAFGNKHFLRAEFWYSDYSVEFIPIQP